MKSNTRALGCWSVLTLVFGCLGAAAVFTLPAYGHDIIGWGEQKTPNAPLTNITKIAGGGEHSLVLKSDGSIVGWGYNYQGQATPPAGSDFVAIAAGGHHSLALKSDGSIVGWGYNGYGQATPPAGSDFVAIAAGGWHSLALKVVCDFVLAGDTNDDCKVDFRDFAVMAMNWLIDCDQTPGDPACVPK